MVGSNAKKLAPQGYELDYLIRRKAPSNTQSKKTIISRLNDFFNFGEFKLNFSWTVEYTNS